MAGEGVGVLSGHKLC